MLLSRSDSELHLHEVGGCESAYSPSLYHRCDVVLQSVRHSMTDNCFFVPAVLNTRSRLDANLLGSEGSLWRIASNTMPRPLISRALASCKFPEREPYPAVLLKRQPRAWPLLGPHWASTVAERRSGSAFLLSTAMRWRSRVELDAVNCVE